MSKAEKYLLTFWFIFNLTIGLFIVRDFGLSYDEPDYYLYAQNTVDAYKSFFALAYSPIFGPHDLPNYGPAFIIFPELAVRFFKLIFPNILVANVWHFCYFFLFQLGGLCLYSLARRWFDQWSAWGILLLYTSQPLLWGHAFINPKDIPFMVFSLFTLWSGFRLADSLGAQNIDVSLKTSNDQYKKLDRMKLSFPHFKVKESLPFLRLPELILAGVLFGMTMSIRLLGPLPGLIVILYLVFTLGQKSLPVITAYLICAIVTTFLTWPYLWPNPIDHWMNSLVLMVNFPWPGHILFNGQFYEPENLPISYLPTLLNIQLTESLLILIYIGLVILIFSIFRERIKLDFFLVVIIGALLPLTSLIITRATMYDNFRQLLFILPPLMLLSGLALEPIFSALKPAALRFVLLIVLALPGIYSIVRLHPYQYTYYNSFAGGNRGAFRRFELDYWFTSYHEAALWLNKNAPANSKIGGDGPTYLLDAYLRPDLNLRPKSNLDEQYDYFLSTSRYNEDLTSYPSAKVIHSIERDGAVLTVIKQPSQ
jgi:4-amino-4-deoxy-L-arabinose transferase-like glycosyltransferase